MRKSCKMNPFSHVVPKRMPTVTGSLDRPFHHLASSIFCLYEVYELFFLLTKHPGSLDSTSLLIIDMLKH